VPEFRTQVKGIVCDDHLLEKKKKVPIFDQFRKKVWSEDVWQELETILYNSMDKIVFKMQD